jgi:hypothetical protein
MSFLRIIDGLERSSATGRQAVQAARIGFLHWACAVEGPVTAQAAESAAARAFAGILKEASRECLSQPMRRGRARVLH